jgi:hypothetical protein
MKSIFPPAQIADQMVGVDGDTLAANALAFVGGLAPEAVPCG